VKSGVACRLVAASAEPHGDLRPARNGHGHPRTDGVAIGGGPLKLQRKEMVLGFDLWMVLGLEPIVEHGERVVLAEQDQVDAAIVFEVAGRKSAAQSEDAPRCARAV
jgi:hypothetical protein